MTFSSGFPKQYAEKLKFHESSVNFKLHVHVPEEGNVACSLLTTYDPQHVSPTRSELEPAQQRMRFTDLS
jgi:hypothetical protein